MTKTFDDTGLLRTLGLLLSVTEICSDVAWVVYESHESHSGSVISVRRSARRNECGNSHPS